MNTPSERSVSARPQSGDTWHAPVSTPASWPAPGRKPNPNPALEKSSVAHGPAPFPAPVRAGAYELPRPVALAPGPSPWPAPAPKALVLRRAAADRADVAFARPPFGSPGEFSRPC